MSTDRLAQLEAQAASLNAEIAKLRAERPAAPPPSPPRAEGVRMRLWGSIAQPVVLTAALRAIVRDVASVSLSALASCEQGLHR